MAEIANTLWYRLGNVTVTDGSTKVTGVGTHWTTAGINPGATLRVDGKYLAHEVKRVVSDTEIELGAAYYGGSTSGAAYSIDRNFQSTTNAKLAADVTDMIGIYEQVRDGTMPMIEGKSAYQVAVANGFIGTEADWVESLKSAGEIVTINSKLDRLYINNAAAHNSHFGGKNLGSSITPEQIAAIRNGTFDNLYPGDYWPLTVGGKSVSAIITGCNIHPQTLQIYGINSLCVWFFNWKITGPMHNIADTTGGLKNMKMYTETLPELLEQIEAVIPSDYIKSFTVPVCDAANSDGTPSHFVNDNVKLFLPSATNFNIHDATAFARSTFKPFSNIIWPYAALSPYTSWHHFWLDYALNETLWAAHHVGMITNYFPANGSATGNAFICPYLFLS